MAKGTFLEWKARVNAVISRKTGGLTSDDLPDCMYHDWYDEGMTPAEAANEAVEAAMEF